MIQPFVMEAERHESTASVIKTFCDGLRLPRKRDYKLTDESDDEEPRFKRAIV